MYCPQCGTPHDPAALFCGSCGTRLARPSAPAVAAFAALPAAPVKKRSWVARHTVLMAVLICVGAFFALVAIGAVAGVIHPPMTPEERSVYNQGRQAYRELQAADQSQGAYDTRSQLISACQGEYGAAVAAGYATDRQYLWDAWNKGCQDG